MQNMEATKKDHVNVALTPEQNTAHVSSLENNRKEELIYFVILLMTLLMHFMDLTTPNQPSIYLPNSPPTTQLDIFYSLSHDMDPKMHKLWLQLHPTTEWIHHLFELCLFETELVNDNGLSHLRWFEFKSGDFEIIRGRVEWDFSMLLCLFDEGNLFEKAITDNRELVGTYETSSNDPLIGT